MGLPDQSESHSEEWQQTIQFKEKLFLESITLVGPWFLHCKAWTSGLHWRPLGALIKAMKEKWVEKITFIKDWEERTLQTSSQNFLEVITLWIGLHQEFNIRCEADQTQVIVDILVEVESTQKRSINDMLERMLSE